MYKSLICPSGPCILIFLFLNCCNDGNGPPFHGWTGPEHSLFDCVLVRFSQSASFPVPQDPVCLSLSPNTACGWPAQIFRLVSWAWGLKSGDLSEATGLEIFNAAPFLHNPCFSISFFKILREKKNTCCTSVFILAYFLHVLGSLNLFLPLFFLPQHLPNLSQNIASLRYIQQIVLGNIESPEGAFISTGVCIFNTNWYRLTNH